MLAYHLRMDTGTGRPSELFSACGPCGGQGCLDKAFLLKRNPRAQPYYVGDAWNLRFKVEDALTFAAVDLTGKLLIATFKRVATDYAGIVRRSDTVIIGSSPIKYQIAIDAQTVDNGPQGVTGRGWFTLRFGSEAADFCQMLSLIGEAVFDLRMQDTVTGDLTTLLDWCFGVYEPKTLFTTPPAPPPPTPGGEVTGTYNCSTLVSVNDFVYLSAIDTVDKASATSIATAPAIGIVIAKPGPTVATVLLGDGEVPGFVGLTTLAQYYLSLTAGLATLSVGAYGAGNVVQKVGKAKSTSVMIIEVDGDYTIL